eukprot:CAMPEP_0194542720 /NCGR_PEP_ID=MMETSP0253-20130528/84522_1 /TAXON_ID=2966 /ORGANISM="Noctiluca scintillans" /LENGTH=98 /DNA_ID=CAMNT_0039389383 /DNA_START=118 /DNA_END=414 /DNA_ORIENTATION=-
MKHCNFCRVCGHKSPDFLAFEDAERRREEQERCDRELTGNLTLADVHHAFEEGSKMMKFEGSVLDLMSTKNAVRNFSDDEAMAKMREWALAAGHEPEF